MTGSPGYVMEDSPAGRTLVVTGHWSDDAGQALARGDADELVLNYARGFCDRSLELLDGSWPLRRLDVLDRSIRDLDPIGRLEALEELSIQAHPDAVLDLEALPRLRTVNGEWGLIGRTLGAVTDLANVITWLFGDVDLHAFRDHLAIKTLTIKDAPYLESLSGIGDLPNLETLTIVAAPRLQEIDDVAALSASLRELKFESCPRIDTIDDVKSLVGLRFLSVSQCGEVASLRPISSLTQLETFYAWGSTRILDGDLSPLTLLPYLKEIRMQNRRGYRPPIGDLSAAVF